MGKVSPKFPSTETGRSFTFSFDSCVTMLCPAQAFPAPTFRYIDLSSSYLFRACGASFTKIPISG